MEQSLPTPQQFCSRAGLGMWVLLWGGRLSQCLSLPWDSVIPPHTHSLPLNSCTALTTMCPLLRAFQAGKGLTHCAHIYR